MAKVTVQLPRGKDHRWKSWVKLLEEVDPEAKNGYGFRGRFLPQGRMADLEEGSYLLFYEEIGSRKHRKPIVSLLKVEPDGTLSTAAQAAGEDWAFFLRGPAAAAVGAAKKNPLAEFSDDELIAELIRRGYVVVAAEEDKSSGRRG